MIEQGAILSGRYVLEDELGQGGMGAVYRATDLRTGAAVAVKVPHPFLARDPVYLERLRREARIAASIRSPRVALVTDFGEHEGTPYLVMEYVPGETISDQIARAGAMSPRDALHVALEVARALEEAHACGIIHRDLKPQNIRRTHRGDVKVLDFGIARLEGQHSLTMAGSLIGSPEYLAPERAEGTGDIRADIYSLGIVLYEMLTGRVPFQGNTAWTVLRQHSSAPLPPLPPGLPPEVYPIVDRCLAKHPDDRFQTSHELATALQDALRALDQRGTAAATPPVTPAATGASAASTIAPTVVIPPGAPGHVAPAQSSGPVAPAPIPVAEPVRAARGGPPGWLVAAGIGAVLIVALGIAGFVWRGRADDGAVRTHATTAQGMSVSGDESAPTVAITSPAEGANVSSPVQVNVTVDGAVLKPPAAGDPAARHLHYFVDTDPATVLGPGQPIPTGVQNIIHTPATNQLLDLGPGKHTVWVVITDNNHIPLSGTYPKVSFTVTGTSAVARTGEQAPIVYQSLVDGKWRLFIMDGRGGNAQRLSTGAWDDIEAAWSPDGARIAFVSNRDGRFHLYVMSADGSGVQQLTSGDGQERSPAWSPDGSRIAYHARRDGRDEIYVIPASGGEARQVTRTSGFKPSWSPDSRQLAYVREQEGVTHIYVTNADGSSEPRQLTTVAQRHIDPAWSPDGRRIAFVAFRNNRWNIYVMDADGSNVRQVTREELDRHPAWSPDGRQLVFASGRDGQQQIFALPLEGGQLRRLTEGLAHNILPSWPRK